MAFCSQCGNRVGLTDMYCARCGARQPAGVFPAPGPMPAVTDPLAGISAHTFSMLCYLPVIGWVASVIVLGAGRFRRDKILRFHAFQGLYIFAAWLVVDWAVAPIFASFPHQMFQLDGLLKAFLVVVWVFMLIKAHKGEAYSLPIVGELAHRSVNERP